MWFFTVIREMLQYVVNTLHFSKYNCFTVLRSLQDILDYEDNVIESLDLDFLVGISLFNTADNLSHFFFLTFFCKQ